jgi:FkbM family methyltransferase
MIGNLAKKLIGYLGYGVYDNSIFKVIKRNTGEWSEEDLRRHNLEAEIIVDTGVAEGAPQLYRSFPDAYFMMVNPLKESKKYIKKYVKTYNCEFIECALGEKEGESVINVEKSGIGASGFLDKKDSKKREGEKENRRVKINRLDKLIESENYTDKNIGIKIDVEGYETNVLRRAKNTLKITNLVICELSISDRFYNGSNIWEVSRFLYDKGFYMSDILGKPGGLFVDTLFEKR